MNLYMPHGVPLPIKSYLLVYAMPLLHFRELSFNIFSNLVHDNVEVYMDDFTIYGNTYEKL
jgi:hypothetical protein